MNYDTTTAELYATLKCMEQYGGGFVRRLAELYQVADSENGKRILNAFPDVFERYHPKNWRTE